ncbi:MAG: DUF6519 domain-containing protein [Phycisphaerales bacterium]
MQQGRVQLDAEWNEQQDILAHRAAAEIVDAVGAAGAPKHQAAFGVVAPATLDPETTTRLTDTKVLPLPAGDLLFSPGRFWAEGTLCEAEDYYSLSHQPDLPGAEPIQEAGSHLVYLDVWQRHLTALDDDDIREKALGGPDTTTRTKTVWQIKTKPVQAAKCISDPEDWASLGVVTPTTGRLAARARPEPASDTPCILSPQAGYRGLENQLYRVEIHDPGKLGNATFKWSRDNGVVVTRLRGLAVDKTADKTVVTATVEDLGRDAVLGFNNGDWVELIDDDVELNGKPGVMAKINGIDRTARTVTLENVPDGFQYSGEHNPKMRRWDGAGTVTLGTEDNDHFLELETGVQVQFVKAPKASDAWYNTGDYWLIPARTTTNDVEWPIKKDPDGKETKDAKGFPVPVELPPLGIVHAYCCLAVAEATMNGNTVTLTHVTDCRKVFPPLTEVDDPEETHKRHNRLLHGWGVVCGLKVHCGGDADRHTVRIEPGYALQCDGTEIDMPLPCEEFPIVNRAKTAIVKPALLDRSGNGRIVLTLALDENGQVCFGVRPPVDENDGALLQRLLAGTFWMDALDGCVRPLWDAIQKLANQPADADKNRLVKTPARRLIAALNLGLEFVNPAMARNVFLSEEEHNLLENLHSGLKKLLQDPVYCGLFDDLPPFPAYPFKKAAILTGFGNAAMTRVRQAPDGRVAYAFGSPGEARVSVFDLTKARGEMTAQIELPAPAAAGALQVQDLAFYDGAKHLLVAATTSNGNSVLYRYKITRAGLSYDPAGEPVAVQNQRVLRVSEITHDTKGLYALVEGTGLVRFNPLGFEASEFTHPLVEFDPTGHWAFGEDAFPGAILAVGMPKTEPKPQFPPVCIISLIEKKPTLTATIPLTGQCTDDLAILFTPVAGRTGPVTAKTVSVRLYIVLDPKPASQKKRLVIFGPIKTLQSDQPSTELELDTNGEVGLAAAADGRFMLVSLADLCQLRWLDPARSEWLTERTLPVQIHPMGIAAGESAVVVVNRDSHTVSVIPAGLISERSSVMLQAVADYRADLLTLARGLSLRLLQHLKDCLCERLVRNCPVCEQDDVIELACVEIRNSKVYHISNCCRREVITFPKLKYWLSVVPVLPLLSRAVREFCSLVLPDLFKPRAKPTVSIVARPTPSYVPTNMLDTLRERLAAPQRRLIRDNLVSRVGQVSKYVIAAAKVQAVAPVEANIAVRSRELVGSDSETARKYLLARQVEVAEIADYDEVVAARRWQGLADLQFDFRPQDRVNLLVKDGKVVMIARVRTPIPAGEVAGSPREPVKEIDRLTAELKLVREAQAAREKELTEIKATIERLQALAAQATPPASGVSKSRKKTK